MALVVFVVLVVLVLVLEAFEVSGVWGCFAVMGFAYYPPLRIDL